MRITIAVLALFAAVAAAPASAATLVIDNWATPSPAETLTASSDFEVAPPGPYGRFVRWQTAGAANPNGANFTIGGGKLQYAPGAGTFGYTTIGYGYSRVPMNIDITPFKFVRLKIVSDSVLNLNANFASSSPTDPGYIVGVNAVGTGTILIPLKPFSPGMDPSHVIALGILIDQSGFGVSPFTLREVALTTAVPEPASWAMMIAGFGLVGAAARRRGAIVTA